MEENVTKYFLTGMTLRLLVCSGKKTDLLRWEIYTQVSTRKDYTISFLKDLVKVGQALKHEGKGMQSIVKSP